MSIKDMMGHFLTTSFLSTGEGGGGPTKPVNEPDIDAIRLKAALHDAAHANLDNKNSIIVKHIHHRDAIVPETSDTGPDKIDMGRHELGGQDRHAAKTWINDMKPGV